MEDGGGAQDGNWVLRMVGIPEVVGVSIVEGCIEDGRVAGGDGVGGDGVGGDGGGAGSGTGDMVPCV